MCRNWPLKRSCDSCGCYWILVQIKFMLAIRVDNKNYNFCSRAIKATAALPCSRRRGSCIFIERKESKFIGKPNCSADQISLLWTENLNKFQSFFPNYLVSRLIDGFTDLCKLLLIYVNYPQNYGWKINKIIFETVEKERREGKEEERRKTFFVLSLTSFSDKTWPFEWMSSDGTQSHNKHG